MSDYFVCYDDGKLIIEDEYSFQDVDYQREGMRFEEYNLYPIYKVTNKYKQQFKLVQNPSLYDDNFKGFIAINSNRFIPIENVLQEINSTL